MGRLGSRSLTAGVGIGRRDVLWLLAAVLFHALLLAIPVDLAETPQTRPQRVEIALRPNWRPPTPSPLQTVTSVEHASPAIPELPAAKTASALEQQDDAPLQADLTQPPAAILSVARLLDSASRIKWDSPAERANRRLGVFTPRPAPENWRPRILVEDNRFDDAILPTRTLVIDRWLAADGSHNMVIETPTGHTLCGRAEPWNPMSPLYEPIMMFRPCGGGGERSFKMARRLNARHELPDVP